MEFTVKFSHFIKSRTFVHFQIPVFHFGNPVFNVLVGIFHDSRYIMKNEMCVWIHCLEIKTFWIIAIAPSSSMFVYRLLQPIVNKNQCKRIFA